METAIQSNLREGGDADHPMGKARFWAGRVLTALPVLFMLMDGIMKLFRPEIVVKSTVELGYSESVIVPLGVVLVASTVLYAIPRTAVLGAILLTGYLGGAVATHVRVGTGAFAILFPVVFGAMVWGGLYLRDKRISNVIPFRN